MLKIDYRGGALTALALLAGAAFFAGAARGAAPGDIVINEILQNPSAVSDGNGEWFEL